LPVGVRAAALVNLMEDTLEPVPVEANGVHFDLRPFEIKTLRLEFGAADKAPRRQPARTRRGASKAR
jgi:hypothetical protein